ncbi:MAG: glycosyltransferase family 39 protein [Ignavibacteriaceae bacterium]
MKKFIDNNKFLFLISFATFLIIFASSFTKGYGFFIDEFYYLACADKLAFGYVDHPPLAPFLLRLITSVFGDSLLVVRFFPAVAASVTAFLTGKLAEEFGGKTYAKILAALAVMTSPVVLAFAGFFSMNAFEPVIALLLFLCIIKITKEPKPSLYIYAGILIGLGIMNKHTFALVVVVLIISLLLAPQRKILFNRWAIVSMLTALVLVLPNFIWQIINGFPSLEFYHNITFDKNIYTPAGAFLLQQILMIAPFALPLTISGTVYLFANKDLKNYRFFVFFFIGTIILIMLTGTSRPDRTLYAYPIVFAAGALFFEHFLSRFSTKFFYALPIVILIIGLGIVLPLVLPYFSFETVKEYVEKIGLNTEIERGKKPPLPQILADRIGWEEKVELMRKAYTSLSVDERNRALLAGSNYGQAGAIDYYGKKYHFPPAVSGHNNYYLWSKENLHGDILLQMDNIRSLEDYQSLFDSVQAYGNVFQNQYVSSHENNLVIFICRGAKYPLRRLLDMGKSYH